MPFLPKLASLIHWYHYLECQMASNSVKWDFKHGIKTRLVVGQCDLTLCHAFVLFDLLRATLTPLSQCINRHIFIVG